MHETVENRVGERRVADDLMPLVDGKLAGHDRRADAVAVLEDLEQVVAVFGGEGGQPPVVHHQHFGLGKRLEQLRVAAVGARDGQRAQQPGDAQVQRAVTVAAGAVGQRAGYPALADAGRAADQDVEVLADPASVGEREDQLLVEAAAVPEVNVLDAGVVLQLGPPQPVGELAGVTLGQFAVDEQPEPFLERQGVDLGGVELLDVKLPQFRGHLSSWRGGGVHDAENETAVPGGIPTADGRAGSIRT